MSGKSTNHSADFKVVSGQGLDVERHKRCRERWEHYTRTLELAPAPLQIDIELTNACDLRCAFCESLSMKRKKGMMSFELFTEIVRQAKEAKVDSAKLNLWGESVLHPKLAEMIKAAKEIYPELALQFNTNANRLSSEVSKGLVEAGLDKLTVSIDGTTPEVYSSLRVGGDYDAVVRNVMELAEWKRRLGAKLPELTVQMIRMKQNIHQVDGFVKKWEGIADRVSVTNIGVTAVEDILAFSVREGAKKGRKPCEQLWQRLSVFWDGTVTVCCNDFEGFLKIGHLSNDTLLGLWKGPKLEALRKRHKALDFEGLVCQTCSTSYDFE